MGVQIRALAAACMLTMASVGAHAAPLTVSAGESVLFNIDFIAAGLSDAPPYYSMAFLTGSDAWTPGDEGVWSFYRDLDGQGGSPLEPFTHLGMSSVNGQVDGWLDGQFSVRLDVTGGSVTVDPFAKARPDESARQTEAVFATVRNCSQFPGGGNTGGCFPGPGPFPAPEPATLALVGAALLGITATRRRKLAPTA